MSLVSIMCVKTSDSEWLPEGWHKIFNLEKRLLNKVFNAKDVSYNIHCCFMGSYKRRKYRSHHRIEKGTVNIRTGLRTVESIFR